MANTKKSVVEILATQGQSLTPYEVYRIWSEAVSTIDASRELKPQMAYNYDRNGLIVKGRSAKVTGTAGRYTSEEAVAFVSKWVKKNYQVEWPTIKVDENAEIEGQTELEFEH